jgi:rhodanese-related sulfurtransferase
MNRILGGAAIALGLLAAVARTPYAPGGTERLEAGRISAVELGELIRARTPGLLVVDLRSQADYDAFHLPTAERRTAAQLEHMRFDSGATVVVYADSGTAARAAWGRLRRRGLATARYLEDGAGEWIVSVLNPTLARRASAEERERFRSVTELSRYFGGLPRAADADPADSSPRSRDELLNRTIRRGCAF